MTALAKLLVFLTLVAGVGAAVFATAVYTQRPPWFADLPDGAAPRGNVVLTFKGLAKDTDAQGKAAAAASALAGQNLRQLRSAEAERAARAAVYAQLLTAARTGNVGFLELTTATDGRLEVVEELSGPVPAFGPKLPTTAVKGPDGQVLKGAETLQADIQRRTDLIVKDLTPKIEMARAEQKRLGLEIELVGGKLARHREIRQDLQNEAAYLGAAEVNVAEQQGTAARRKAQLEGRLRAFTPPKL